MMFGYVTINKDELKIGEYHVFRAYYCGLCREIGAYSQFARLGLSYDMTFLYILLSSLSEQPLRTEPHRCLAHPGQKRAVALPDEAALYSAQMSILLVYLKCKDDWHDEKSIRALTAMAAYFPAVRRIKAAYPEQYRQITEHLTELSRLERENCSEIDQAADCFAQILSVLFTPPFVQDEKIRRSLSWLGYNTGRWIYIIDAYHDMEKDQKKRQYNPLLASERETQTLKADLDMTLTYTLSSITSAYELLPICKNDAILRNILYLGLKSKQDSILKGKVGTADESVSNTGRK